MKTGSDEMSDEAEEGGGNKGTVIIVAIAVVAILVLLFFYVSKQPTRSEPSQPQQVQVQSPVVAPVITAEKSPVVEKVVTAPSGSTLTPAPIPAPVTAPISATPVIQNNINIYQSPVPTPEKKPAKQKVAELASKPQATLTNPVPQPTTPAPMLTPPVVSPPQPPSTSTPSAPAALVIGQPQAYYNSWGWWLVDPNGGFHCPPLVSNPTTWTGGMQVHVQRDGRSYNAWAPACYR